MVIKNDEVYKNLKKKGFLDAPGDHNFLEFHHNGKFIVRTKISHGAAHDLGNDLISKMSNQCKLDKSDFLDLANCPLSQESYINKLIHKGVIKG